MRRISLDVDEETFKAFSKKCIDVGKKKAEVLRELIERWLHEEN